MLSDNLFNDVLIAPAKEHGIDRLQIVSGFATANMADQHMKDLADIQHNFNIELIIGMSRQSGIEKAQHYAFRKLVETQPYGIGFSCRYVVSGSPVHAKTYCWFNNGLPVTAFAGSANYTRRGFGRTQVETMLIGDANAVAEFQTNILQFTANCLDTDIDKKIALTESRQITNPPNNSTPNNSVNLSLLDKRTQETPQHSGINWGQREGRNRNQAYINIPTNIIRQGFFPERFERFTVLTDDGKSFIMVRAQDGGKGLHTTENNAFLGQYLRDRMGLSSGCYVTREDLVKYGRTDVTFLKIDNETYLLNFLPNVESGKESKKIMS